MADVVELCKRVIIISEGAILYDGNLSGVISKFSSHKIVEVILEDCTTKNYKVPRSKIAERTSKLLKDLPIADINIKEVAIEEIIQHVFAKK
jgi:ABC-2 type transport system ATP-binding protein